MLNVAFKNGPVAAVDNFVRNPFFADVGAAEVVRLGEDIQPMDSVFGV